MKKIYIAIFCLSFIHQPKIATELNIEQKSTSTISSKASDEKKLSKERFIDASKPEFESKPESEAIYEIDSKQILSDLKTQYFSEYKLDTNELLVEFDCTQWDYNGQIYKGTFDKTIKNDEKPVSITTILLKHYGIKTIYKKITFKTDDPSFKHVIGYDYNGNQFEEYFCNQDADKITETGSVIVKKSFTTMLYEKFFNEAQDVATLKEAQNFNKNMITQLSQVLNIKDDQRNEILTNVNKKTNRKPWFNPWNESRFKNMLTSMKNLFYAPQPEQKQLTMP